jgi:hypothetical protein
MLMISTSFETQLPGTILAVAFLAYLAIEGSGTTNTFFEVIHSKFYAVSLLCEPIRSRPSLQLTVAVLNYRYTLQSEREDTDPYGAQQRVSVTFKAGAERVAEVQHLQCGRSTHAGPESSCHRYRAPCL